MASQKNRCPWRVCAVAGPRRGHQGVITGWGGRAPHILQPLHVQSVQAAPLSPPQAVQARVCRRGLSVTSGLTATQPPAHSGRLCSLPGGILMFGALVLFESEFVHVVAISFTALVLTELLMVALTVRTWHWLMVMAELLSLGCYVASLAFLNEYFGKLPWDCFLNNCLFLVFTCFSCCLCCVIFDTDYRQPHTTQLSLREDGAPCSDAQS